VRGDLPAPGAAATVAPKVEAVDKK
jgi:hypothetical protein